MFTGIIEETGKIRQMIRKTQAVLITIEAQKVLEGLKVGDSIAVNGACLTVEKFDRYSFTATAVSETLSKTTIGTLRAGALVNLERALTFGDRLDGHVVTGHVDTVGQIIEKKPVGEGYEIKVRFPSEFTKWVVSKGSIAIEGTSLTVADVQANVVKIALIPFTSTKTNLVTKRTGEKVNIEFDSLGKYASKGAGGNRAV